jgi:hypothetical protein
MDERIEELLPFYALGVLTGAEQGQVEIYLGAIPAALAQLNQDRKAVAALAYGVRPVNPAPVVKQRLMQQIQRHTAPVRSPRVEPVTAKPSAWSGLLNLFRSPGVMPAMAGLSLVAALLAGSWVYALNQQMGRLQQQNAQMQRQVQQQDEALQTLQAQLGPLQTVQKDNIDLQQVLAAQAAQITAQADQLTTQGEQVANLNAQIEPLQVENINLKRQLAEQSDKLVAMEEVQQAGVTREAVAALEQELAAQREMVASLTNQVTQLQSLNTSLGQELSTQRAIMAEVTAPDVQAMTIAGTESLPQAHGQLIANPNADEAVVIVAGLLPLQPGYVYQFWLVESDQLIRAGVFSVDEAGLGVLRLSTDNTPIGSYDAMGVSIEPADNENSPANEMIMLGSFSS